MYGGVVGEDLRRNRGSVMLRLQQLRMNGMLRVLSRSRPSMLSRVASFHPQGRGVSGKAQAFNMPFVPQIEGRPPSPRQQRFGGKTGTTSKTGSLLGGGPEHPLQLFLPGAQSGETRGKGRRPCGKASLPFLKPDPSTQRLCHMHVDQC